jgi:hypothetical protein
MTRRENGKKLKQTMMLSLRQSEILRQNGMKEIKVLITAILKVDWQKPERQSKLRNQSLVKRRLHGKMLKEKLLMPRMNTMLELTNLQMKENRLSLTRLTIFSTVQMLQLDKIESQVLSMR